MAVSWIKRQKAGLRPGLVGAKRLHEVGIKLQLLEGLCLAQPRIACRLELGRGAHKSLHQLWPGPPAGAHAPLRVGQLLQPVALALDGVVGHGLQARINRGAQHQPVGVNVVVVAVSPFNQPALELLSQMRRRA